jgi:hypothetical protein
MPNSTIADHLATAAAIIQDRNLRTTRLIHACFVKGDISSILDHLYDGIEWRHAGNPDVIPYAGVFNGKSQVSQFFSLLSENIDIQLLNVSGYRAYNNRVLCDLEIRCVVKPTQTSLETAAACTWIFDANGLVTALLIEGDMTVLETAFG